MDEQFPQEKLQSSQIISNLVDQQAKNAQQKNVDDELSLDSIGDSDNDSEILIPKQKSPKPNKRNLARKAIQVLYCPNCQAKFSEG